MYCNDDKIMTELIQIPIFYLLIIQIILFCRIASWRDYCLTFKVQNALMINAEQLVTVIFLLEIVYIN